VCPPKMARLQMGRPAQMTVYQHSDIDMYDIWKCEIEKKIHVRNNWFPLRICFFNIGCTGSLVIVEAWLGFGYDLLKKEMGAAVIDVITALSYLYFEICAKDSDSISWKHCWHHPLCMASQCLLTLASQAIQDFGSTVKGSSEYHRQHAPNKRQHGCVNNATLWQQCLSSGVKHWISIH